MTQAQINRRHALAVVAAIPAAAALSAPALASVGEDAELRQLWAQYLAQLEVSNKAGAVYSERRVPYVAEFDLLKDDYRHRHGFGELHEILWKKHGIEAPCAACNPRRPEADPHRQGHPES